MPVTIPGSAIGRTATKLTALRPKNRCRVSANDASVPSTSAIADASTAVSNDRKSASRGPDA